MTPAETITILRQFNEWRRCDEDIPQPDTREIGEAIDVAVEMIDRLEAAEKERDALRVDKATLQQMLYSIKNRLEAAEKSDAESLAMYRKARDERDALRAALQHEADCVEAAKAEIEALCAKVEAMEKQEPVAWCTTDETGTFVEALGMNQSRRFDTALYLAPGAQGEEK